MRTWFISNRHRLTVEDPDLEREWINLLDASKVHTIAIVATAMIGIDAAGLAEKVIDHFVVPPVVAQLVHIRWRLKIRLWNAYDRHDRTLANADRAIATEAFRYLFAYE